MADIDLGEDDGYVSVHIGEHSVQLDLWETNNRIYTYHETAKNKPDADYNAGLVDLMESLGLPRVSHRMAARFVESINRTVADLKKNAESACRIARFYGIDSRGMSRIEREVWEANIPAVYAEEVLRERGGSLSADELYHVTLLSTDDRDRAARARARRWLQEHQQRTG